MKKVVLASILFMTLFIFTGCGASVTSQTKFQQDGSGTRTISAVISAKDAKNLDGGFYELDLLLEEAAPEGVSIGRTMLENGDAKYQFSFHFNNIDEYNEIISKITGKQHNATWYNNSSVFLSDIEFSERECTYDLISWALDAFKNSKYSKFSSYFNLYEVTKNEVYYNDQIVFTGSTNPSFSVQTSPTVKRASMYSDYSYDGSWVKKLVIEFNEGALEAINLEDAKPVLDAYSTSYKIDLANNRITYTLEGDDLYDFFMSADMNCKKEDLTYLGVYNPFQKKYEIKESYNLKEFFSMFQMEYPYIYNYIKVPEIVADSHVSYLNHLDGIEVPEGYDYAGAYRYDSTYTADIYSNQMVDLTGMTVTYDITKELDSRRVVQVEYTKNGCSITEKELMKYYPNIKENIAVTDDDDTIKITFTTKVERGDSKEEVTSNLYVDRLPRRSLKYIRYDIRDELTLADYLPVLDGYSWKTDRIEYTYHVNVESGVNVDTFTVNGTTYSKEDNSLSALQSSASGYVKEGTIKGIDSIFSVDITSTTVYDLYYFWIIVVLFIIIVAILVTAVVYIRKQSKIPEEKDL